jgi:hypothetical protein
MSTQVKSPSIARTRSTWKVSTTNRFIRPINAEAQGLRNVIVRDVFDLARTENEVDLVKARVRFHISFTNPPDPTIRHDLWTYGRVAEGWLRRPQD